MLKFMLSLFLIVLVIVSGLAASIFINIHYSHKPHQPGFENYGYSYTPDILHWPYAVQHRADFFAKYGLEPPKDGMTITRYGLGWDIRRSENGVRH